MGDRDRPVPDIHVALFPWGGVIEDFLGPIGVCGPRGGSGVHNGSSPPDCCGMSLMPSRISCSEAIFATKIGPPIHCRRPSFCAHSAKSKNPGPSCW